MIGHWNRQCVLAGFSLTFQLRVWREEGAWLIHEECRLGLSDIYTQPQGEEHHLKVWFA